MDTINWNIRLMNKTLSVGTEEFRDTKGSMRNGHNQSAI